MNAVRWPVLVRSLQDRRRSTFWWAVGMIALAAITIAFVPSIRSDAEAFMELYDSLPEGLMSVFGIDDSAALVTAEGLINSRLYAGVGPAILAVFGIGLGTAAVAGEEDTGTLNMLLAQPIARWRVVVEKFAAGVVLTFVICVAIAVTLAVSNPLVDLGLGWGNIVAANLGLALFTLVFLGLSLALGAVTGNRGLTIGVSAAITVAAFFVNGLAPLVDELSWAQNLSPFYWIQGPDRLTNGFSPGWSLLMVAVTAVLVVAAVIGFDRRDIDV